MGGGYIAVFVGSKLGYSCILGGGGIGLSVGSSNLGFFFESFVGESLAVADLSFDFIDGDLGYSPRISSRPYWPFH